MKRGTIIDELAPTTILPVWIRPVTAGALIERSPKALMMMIYRGEVPSSLVRRLGRSVLIHRERFLQWIEGELSSSR